MNPDDDTPQPDDKPADDQPTGESDNKPADDQPAGQSDDKPADDQPAGQADDPPASDDYEGRGKVALKKMQDANHPKGSNLRGKAGQGAITAGDTFPQWFMELQNAISISGVWKDEEEEGQLVLRDYANSKIDADAPASLTVFFDYVGRSSQNDADALKQGKLGASHFGGVIKAPNWCTTASRTALVDGLNKAGYAPQNQFEIVNQLQKVKPKMKPDDDSGDCTSFFGPNAYAEDLQPGDIVAFIFHGSQYGGHTGTVIKEDGESFTHVSGNTGDAIGVGISEAKRTREAPQNLALNKTLDSSQPDPTKAYIESLGLGDRVLVYSIVRAGMIFTDLSADGSDQTLAKYKVKKL
jgi:hypothetical protein